MMDKFVVDLDQLLNDFEQSEQSRILGEIDPNLRHESKAINANDEPQLIVFDESDHIKVSHSSASDETEACHTMTDPISFSKKCDNEKENHVERSASNVSKTELIDQPNCSKEFIANDTNQEQPYSLLLIDGLHKEGAVTVESPKSIDEIQNCCDQSEKKEIKNESIIDQDPIESCSSDLLANLLKPNLPESRPSEINQSIDRENGQSVLDLLDNCPIDFQPLTVNANQNDLILNDDVLLDSREIVDNAFMPSQESNYKISDENKVDCDSNEKIRDSNKVPSDSTQSNTVFHAESDSDVIFTDKLNQPDSSRSFAQMDLVLSENSCPTSNDPTVDEFEPKLTSSTANHPSDNAAPELNSDLTTSQNFTAMQTNRDENLEHVTQDDSSPTPSQFQPLPSLTNSIGYVRPYWMPDQEAPNCLGCSLRFTVIKRRHHCRACGKVYCAACSTQKAKLPYMDFKEARVCATCFDLLDHVRIEQQASSASVAHSLVSNAASPNSSPFHRRSSNASAVGQASQATAGPATLNNTWSNPNYLPVPANPLEYCSTVPPIEQASASTPLPVVFVPVSVLRRPDKPRRESALSKQVIFSDGIRPGGDLTETPASASNSVGISANFAFPNKASTTKGGKRFKLPQIIESNPIANSSKKQCLFLHDSNGELPPMLATDNLNEDCTAESIMALVSDPLAEALYFQLSKNLIVRIKRTRLDCCTHQLCWVLTTAGLSSVGQDELILLLETNPQEQAIPRDLFRLVRVVHDYANRGQPFSDLNHILFEDGLFANPDIGGFIFFRPNLHCLQQVHLPVSPFLVALLIQKAEVPWAKIFPLRLLLRMGADSAQYPSPIVSVRTRRPCFEEIGHTIMNVLADFRNYQYTMPFIPGLFIQMLLGEVSQEITISICKSRHDQVMKALSSSNEHVLAFGASFNQRASAHFTCSKSDDGQYQSELFTTQNRTCEYRQLMAQGTMDNANGESNSASKATSSSLYSLQSALADIGLPADSLLAANFVVFSGALKSSTGLTAKFSVVEDGFLVQISSNTLEQLKEALKESKDFTICCGRVDSQTPDEVVRIVWEEEDKYFNVGVQSLIDELPLDGVPSIRIFNGTDCVGEKYLIRWIEVFFIKYDRSKRKIDFNEPTRMANLLAHSLCVALTPHLEQLFEGGVYRIALRVTLNSDNLGYEVSSNKGQLQATYANELDNALIPIIMGNFASSSVEESLIMELLFHVLEK